MEGGRIVQCGTPQEIYTKPANAYVADFVAHMNPLGVLTARDVIAPLTGDATGEIDASEKLVALMPHFQESEAPIKVMHNREAIGEITKTALLKRLIAPKA